MELPPDYQAGMLQGIVGFEIEIGGHHRQVQAQPEPAGRDRERVAAALAAGSPDEQEVAQLMHQREG